MGGVPWPAGGRGGSYQLLLRPPVTVCAAGLCNFVEERVAVEDTVRNQPWTAKLRARVNIPLFTPSLVTLTLLLLLATFPRH